MRKAEREFREGWDEAHQLFHRWRTQEDWLARGMLIGTYGTYSSPNQIVALRTNPHLRGFGAYLTTMLRKHRVPRTERGLVTALDRYLPK